MEQGGVDPGNAGAGHGLQQKRRSAIPKGVHDVTARREAE